MKYIFSLFFVINFAYAFNSGHYQGYDQINYQKCFIHVVEENEKLIFDSGIFNCYDQMNEEFKLKFLRDGEVVFPFGEYEMETTSGDRIFYDISSDHFKYRYESENEAYNTEIGIMNISENMILMKYSNFQFSQLVQLFKK